MNKKTLIIIAVFLLIISILIDTKSTIIGVFTNIAIVIFTLIVIQKYIKDLLGRRYEVDRRIVIESICRAIGEIGIEYLINIGYIGRNMEKVKIDENWGTPKDEFLYEFENFIEAMKKDFSKDKLTKLNSKISNAFFDDIHRLPKIAKEEFDHIFNMLFLPSINNDDKDIEIRRKIIIMQTKYYKAMRLIRITAAYVPFEMILNSLIELFKSLKDLLETCNRIYKESRDKSKPPTKNRRAGV